MALHTFSYIFAGMIAFGISSDLYEGEGRLLDFLVDPKEEGAGKFTWLKVIPAQVIRGLLMSVVLYPALGWIGGAPFSMKFLFFGGLMLIYTDLSSAAPFPSNIEGIVYMKKNYLGVNVFWKTQAEMIIYSAIFGLLGAWLLG